MNNLNFTILTDPNPNGLYFLHEKIKIFYKFLNKKLKKDKSYYYNSNFMGHGSVTRSLIHGLRICGITHNYNPKKFKEYYENVIVLSGVNTLKEAIILKKQGLIKRIFAGPNIVTFANEKNFLLGSSYIDKIIVPSNWVKSLYVEDLYNYNDKIIVWPAGVDLKYWSPNTNLEEKKKILIYDKRSQNTKRTRIEPYLEYLKNSSSEYHLIINSDSEKYTSEKFKDYLNESYLMVAFTVGSESQGIAWAESWAMNVPTLIKKQNTNYIKGRKVISSTAPYLSKDNGLFFDDFDDFKVKLDFIKSNLVNYSPREWVKNNMSDEVCALNLFEKLQN